MGVLRRHFFVTRRRINASSASQAGETAPRPPELLLLDEPTNHLDMDAVSLLESALQSYDGAILAISHDERFLDAIGIERQVDLGKRVEVRRDS